MSSRCLGGFRCLCGASAGSSAPYLGAPRPLHGHPDGLDEVRLVRLLRRLLMAPASCNARDRSSSVRFSRRTWTTASVRPRPPGCPGASYSSRDGPKLREGGVWWHASQTGAGRPQAPVVSLDAYWSRGGALLERDCPAAHTSFGVS